MYRSSQLPLSINCEEIEDLKMKSEPGQSSVRQGDLKVMGHPLGDGDGGQDGQSALCECCSTG